MLFPQMKPEKKAPKDSDEKFEALGISKDIIPVLRKCGYNIVTTLDGNNPQKIQMQIGEVIKKYNLEIDKPSVNDIAEWLKKLEE